MEKTNKKECPKCKSSNVIVSVLTSGAIVQKISGTYPEPTRPALYQCLKCGGHFSTDDDSEQN